MSSKGNFQVIFVFFCSVVVILSMASSRVDSVLVITQAKVSSLNFAEILLNGLVDLDLSNLEDYF